MNLNTPRTRITPAQYLQIHGPIQDGDIEEYKQILKLVSDKRLNIKEIACLTDRSYGYTGLRIRVLEVRGFIKKVFEGQNRVIILTEEGRGLIEGVGV